MRPFSPALCTQVKQITVAACAKHNVFWQLALAHYVALDFYHRLNWLLHRLQFVLSSMYLTGLFRSSGLLLYTVSWRSTVSIWIFIWILITAINVNAIVACIHVFEPTTSEWMLSSSHLTDIVHRDLKLENILVEKSVGDDNGRINIKVRWWDKLTDALSPPLLPPGTGCKTPVASLLFLPAMTPLYLVMAFNTGSLWWTVLCLCRHTQLYVACTNSGPTNAEAWLAKTSPDQIYRFLALISWNKLYTL